MESEPGGSERLLDVGRGGLVTAKGTADGLVLRLDGSTDSVSLQRALAEFIEPRKSFLTGNRVLLEWINRPQDNVEGDVRTLLSSMFNITVREAAGTPKEQRIAEPTINTAPAPAPADRSILNAPSRSKSLFDGMDEIGALNQLTPSHERLMDPAAWDDADGRIVYTTLRSGQRIETEHSLILIGDVNPGAELIAGGDIMVLGCLRGIAHAGAYDETGGGRMIFALQLQPTQLRIGTTISRGSTESGSVPEVARIEGNIIVVEAFLAKSGKFKRLAGNL